MKHLNKNENYIEILEIPFIFNLRWLRTGGRRTGQEDHVRPETEEEG